MKRLISNLSLKFKIAFIFTFIIFLLLFITLLIVGTETSTNFQKEKEVQYLQLVQSRAQQVAAVLKKITTAQDLIANNEALYSSDPKAVQKAIDQYKRMGNITDEVPFVAFIWPDGKGYTSLGNTIDIHDRDYFQPLQSGAKDFVISSAIISRTTHQPSVNFLKTLRKPDNTIQGFIQLNVNLTSLSNISSGIKAEDSGYGWICDQTGLILAYPQKEQIMKLNLATADTQGYKGINDFTQKMLSTNLGSGYWQKKGIDMMAYYSRIPESNGWYLGISIPAAEINDTINGIINILLFLLISGVVIAILVSVLLANSIVKPIKSAAASFKKLAQGEADLTKSIVALRNDEVGALAKDFNSFVGKLREIVITIKNSQEEISKISTALNASSEETVATVLQISGNITHVSAQTKLQTDSAVSSSAAVEEIAKNIESLDRVISEQVSSVTEASAAIEEMARNIDSVFQSIEKLSTEYQSLIKNADDGKEAREKSEALIQAISQRSSSLLEANRSIADIAGQTNLLAMNAAIEAAHAGQSGKGFAVVADEIRKLAENSSLQSKAISKDIDEVQNNINELVTTSINLGNILGHVETKITETKTIVQEVHNAMSEQKQGSKQMLEVLQNLNNVSVSVKTGSEEMKNGNITLLNETNQLRLTAQQVQESVLQISAGAEQLNRTAKDSASMAQNTKNAVNNMDKAVGRFKV